MLLTDPARLHAAFQPAQPSVTQGAPISALQEAGSLRTVTTVVVATVRASSQHSPEWTSRAAHAAAALRAGLRASRVVAHCFKLLLVSIAPRLQRHAAYRSISMFLNVGLLLSTFKWTPPTMIPSVSNRGGNILQ